MAAEGATVLAACAVVQSKSGTMGGGIPQESPLSPILYSLYMADFSNINAVKLTL